MPPPAQDSAYVVAVTSVSPARVIAEEHPASPRHIGARLLQLGQQRGLDVGEQGGGSLIRGRENRNPRAVEPLQQEPSARPQGCHEPFKYGDPLRQVQQDQPGVDHVVVAARQRIVDDVVAQQAYLRRPGPGLGPAGVEVGHRDLPLRTDPFPHPRPQRAAAPADFQATETGGQAGQFQLAAGDAVVARLQGREAVGSAGVGVVEQVAGHGVFPSAGSASSARGAVTPMKTNAKGNGVVS